MNPVVLKRIFEFEEMAFHEGRMGYQFLKISLLSGKGIEVCRNGYWEVNEYQY